MAYQQRYPQQQQQQQQQRFAGPAAPYGQPMSNTSVGSPVLAPPQPAGGAYPQEVQPQPPQQRPPIFVDKRRHQNYFVDDYLYSVQLDADKLEWFYCWQTCPFCCNNKALAQMTWMDVHTSGVVVGRPTGCCCIAKPSRGVKAFFDDPEVFGAPAQKGTCCLNPYPYLCTNRCDCCGEALVLPGGCTCRCCPSGPIGLANEYNTCSLLPLCSMWCLPISVMYGLKEGEAERAASVINNAKSIYAQRGNYTWHNPSVAAAARQGGVGQHLSPASAPPMPMGAQPLPQPQYAQQQQRGGAPSSRAVPTPNEPYAAAAYSAPAPAPYQQPQQQQQQQPRMAFRLPDGDWAWNKDSGMYWSEEQQLYLRTTDGHFYDPHSTQWYNPDTETWYS